MRLRPDQLAAHLDRGLAPAYLVAGDETLLVEEAGDLIRAAARGQGFGEREVIPAEGGLDPQVLAQSAGALSLFATRRLLEVRLPAKLGAEAGKAVAAYAARPAPDTVLLVFSERLDAKSFKTAWYRELERHVAVVAVAPVEAARLPAWVQGRMREKGLAPSPEAVKLLAERVEGNLLACAQEIDKLLLLRGPGPVDADAVAESVADSARFDVFILVDAALAGDVRRTQRVLAELRGEGVEAPIVLWALARELRALARLAHDVDQGLAPAQALARHGVWERRKALVGRALRRLDARGCRALLGQAAAADRAIKGLSSDAPWDTLTRLALGLAGAALPEARVPPVAPLS
jgi:DNA polymerase-3 subunit delta